MSRSAPTAFLDPLIHGFEVVCKKVEKLVGSGNGSPNGSTRNTPLPVNGRRSIASYPFADEDPEFPWMPSPARHHRDLVNLPAIAEQLAARYAETADERAVRILVNVAPDALLIGDGASIHWVLAQLVAIAVDDAPYGGRVMISGAVSNGVITITLSEHFLNRLSHTLPHSRDVSFRSGNGREPEERSFVRPSSEKSSAHTEAE